MTKKITSLLIAATFISAIAVAQSFSALYTFDSVKTNSGFIDPSPLPVVTHVVLDSFSSVGASANPNATGRFSFTNWPLGAIAGQDGYDTLSGSIDLAKYFEVTIAPANGYTLDLSYIGFSVQRSGTGIRTYAVRSSADGYASNLSASIAPSNANLSVQAGDVFYWNFDATTSNQNGSLITLSGLNYTGVSTPLTFRFYGWNAEGAGGTFSIDNVTITGVANNVSITPSFIANNVCEGDSIHFMDMSTSVINIAGWAWNFGGISPPVLDQNPVHYFPVGMHPVTLTVTDDSANTNSYTDTVYVYPKPVADFATYSGIGYCAGADVLFADSSSIASGSIANYMWNFGNPSSGTNDTSSLSSLTHTYSTAGTYTATQIITSDMGCKDTLAVDVVVAANPIAIFTYSGTTGSTVSFMDASTGGVDTWYWDFDMNASNDNATTSNPFYTYPANGNYTACVTVTNTAGCSDTVCQTINVSDVSIAETLLESAVQVYPSPSKDGLFTIDLANQTLNFATANVYNVIGKVVYSMQLQNSKNVLDLSGMDNGTYFIAITSDKDIITKRVIINK